MTFENFKGAGKALDQYDIPQLAYRVNVSEDHLQAFLNVESRSQGFDRQGRPIILTEPHVFYRNLKGAERDKAVKLGLAYREWGEKPYPKTSDDRYEWLRLAMTVNEAAALKACSWGSTQILGENFSVVGFATVQDMVRAFMGDEEEHVEAMVKFILANGIDDDLRAERWDVVARVYNGPGYEKNKYDVKMAREFAKLRGVPDAGWSPDEPGEVITPDEGTLKSIQRRLGELGYTEVGWADGKWGTKTRAGVVAFRMDHGLPIYDRIDRDFMAALMGANPREISSERSTTTASDLRAAGSRQIAASDGATVGGVLTGAGGAVAATGAVLKSVEENVGVVDGIMSTVQPYFEMVQPLLPWAALALGAFVVYHGWKGRKARVEDHRVGKTSFAGPL